MSSIPATFLTQFLDMKRTGNSFVLSGLLPATSHGRTQVPRATFDQMLFRTGPGVELWPDRVGRVRARPPFSLYQDFVWVGMLYSGVLEGATR